MPMCDACDDFMHVNCLNPHAVHATLQPASCTGVLGFQGDGGFYLLHSTPKYPTDLTQYKGMQVLVA